MTVTPAGQATVTAGRRPATVTPASRVTATAGARPATVTPAGRVTATAGGRPPRTAVPVTATAAGRTATAGTAALSCAMNTTIAPRGGYINLTGAGFGNQVRITIGGRNAVISSRRGTQLRVQIPRNSSGGNVVLSSGQRSSMLNVR